ncbi:MAG TPA: carboxypeptidase regulatory-like domain-containing protein, partial [Niastella sp.]|nr:carboxypeptidase regulatory-like domain-containing protein [Niastella sp.]
MKQPVLTPTFSNAHIAVSGAACYNSTTFSFCTGAFKNKFAHMSRRNSFSAFVSILLLCGAAPALAQHTQQVRGAVIDQVLQTPLEGATVTLTALQQSVRTDAKGGFRFLNVPVGVQQVTVSDVGYKDLVLDNINVNSGKETILTLSIENGVKEENAVVIKAASRKNKPLNEMSAVSARAFTVEETQNYAAAVNDPSRMAMGFPGVLATDDGNNNIAIRGNSPTGLLWRMEGIDIPNPNHFSSTGSSGGGISILSSQLLANSDFVTSAF